ncbi:MAG: DNA internalization-related competence protein ComEC/Rec2 [Brachymonas sp.]
MSRAWFWNGILVAWLAGIALQLQQPALWAGGHYAYLGFAALFILIAAQAGFLRKNAKNTLKICLQLAVLMALAALAFASTGWRAGQKMQADLAPALYRQDVQITGEISDLPQRMGADSRFLFAPKSAQFQGQSVNLPQRLQLSWYANQSLPALPAAGLAAGQRWQLTVRLKPVHGSVNPHGFDYELWAFERDIRASGYVRSAQLLADAPVGWAAYAPRNWGSTLSRWRAASRDAVFAQVQDGRQAAVLAALLMGEQGVIERSDWDVFRATGVAHLMSISGLHITLFAWAAALLIGSLWRRSLRLIYTYPAPYAAAWGGLCLAVLYAAFTGWGVPAQRTALMLALATLLRVSGRRWPWHFSLLLVAAVVLAFDPWALLQAGFWLSFVAVGVLLLQNPIDDDKTMQGAAPAQPRWYQRMVLAAHKLLREQWTISLALAPLSLLLFGQFSLVGMAANLLAIPLVTFVITPLVLLGLFLQPLWSLAAWVLQFLLAFLDGCAAWPYAVLHTAALPWGLGAAAVVAALLYLALRQQQAARIWQRGLLLLLLILCAAAWRYQPARPAQGHFEALLVDVGQGNAVLIQTAQHSLLYDTGPRYSSSGSNAGERVLLPLLRALALQPDVLMVSHADSDHSGGAAPILQQLPPQLFYTSMAAQADWPPQPAPQPCTAGQRWRWDGVDFEVLHPQAADYGRGLKSNAMSCVLRISNGQHSVLLAGDIPEAQERDLWLQLGAEKLASTVLLAPHHGSKTSSNLLFLQAVRPRWVLVQAGYLNRYGHPAPQVVQRYADLGLAVRGSAECGAMTWASSQPEALGCLRRDAPRYWWHQPEPDLIRR